MSFFVKEYYFIWDRERMSSVKDGNTLCSPIVLEELSNILGEHISSLSCCSFPSFWRILCSLLILKWNKFGKGLFFFFFCFFFWGSSFTKTTFCEEELVSFKVDRFLFEMFLIGYCWFFSHNCNLFLLVDVCLHEWDSPLVYCSQGMVWLYDSCWIRHCEHAVWNQRGCWRFVCFIL